MDRFDECKLVVAKLAMDPKGTGHEIDHLCTFKAPINEISGQKQDVAIFIKINLQELFMQFVVMAICIAAVAEQ